MMKSFTWHTDYLPLLEKLSDESKGKLIHALTVFAKTGTQPAAAVEEKDELAFSMLYELISSRIEREASRKAETSEARRNAGKASGRSRAAKKGG